MHVITHEGVIAHSCSQNSSFYDCSLLCNHKFQVSINVVENEIFSCHPRAFREDSRKDSLPDTYVKKLQVCENNYRTKLLQLDPSKFTVFLDNKLPRCSYSQLDIGYNFASYFRHYVSLFCFMLQGHSFICQLSVATSFWLVDGISVAHSVYRPHTQWSSRRKRYTIVK